MDGRDVAALGIALNFRPRARMSGAGRQAWPAACLIPITVVIAIVVSTLASREARGATAQCADLAHQALRDAHVLAADAVPGGEFTAPDGTKHTVRAFCRVQGEARPHPDSRIRFEVWLPQSLWSGRYYQLGNGGFAGNIPYALLAGELRRGNAVAATDTGHTGDGFSAQWALGQPQWIIDYGWRSLNATAIAARELIASLYGSAARHRYFVGCSNGGRQALLLAQRFPNDWDGILAGAPAWNWTRQLASFAATQQSLHGGAGAALIAADLPLVQELALASCSAAAQVVRGVARDPRQCRFDPRAHLCSAGNGKRCLTDVQAAAVSRISDGPVDSSTGDALYPGFEPTSAAAIGGWDRWILEARPDAPSQRTLSEQFFRYIVYGDATWSVARFDATRDFDIAQRTLVAQDSLAATLDATQPDLAAFARRGGRLLMYFGWADAVLSPRAGIAYYESVLKQMGGLAPTRSFFRLFMVPGMAHCQGGPGPDAFGQSTLTPGARDDAAHDARRALEAWVEAKRAPDLLRAAKYVDDDPARGVAATAVLCPYPDTTCALRKRGER